MSGPLPAQRAGPLHIKPGRWRTVRQGNHAGERRDHAGRTFDQWLRQWHATGEQHPAYLNIFLDSKLRPGSAVLVYAFAHDAFERGWVNASKRRLPLRLAGAWPGWLLLNERLTPETAPRLHDDLQLLQRYLGLPVSEGLAFLLQLVLIALEWDLARSTDHEPGVLLLDLADTSARFAAGKKWATDVVSLCVIPAPGSPDSIRDATRYRPLLSLESVLSYWERVEPGWLRAAPTPSELLPYVPTFLRIPAALLGEAELGQHPIYSAERPKIPVAVDPQAVAFAEAFDKIATAAALEGRPVPIQFGPLASQHAQAQPAASLLAKLASLDPMKRNLPSVRYLRILVANPGRPFHSLALQRLHEEYRHVPEDQLDKVMLDRLEADAELADPQEVGRADHAVYMGLTRLIGRISEKDGDLGARLQRAVLGASSSHRSRWVYDPAADQERRNSHV